MATIFSKIIAGEIPGNFVCTEEHWVAFLDIMPTAHGHVLLVPRFEGALLADLPTEALVDMGNMVAKMTSCVKTVTQAPAVSVLVRDGSEAGQEVPHVHIHIIPRHQQSEAHQFTSSSYADGEAAAMAKALAEVWVSA